jgi:hypothetical protein
MTDFKLVNPVIIGTFDNKFTAPTVDDAAKSFWEKLTEGKYISGNVPLFYYSLMNIKNNEISHFKVKEMPSGKYAEYSIEKININMSKTEKDKFLKGVDDISKSSVKLGGGNLTGGKRRRRSRSRRDDDSSSSDSDLDDLFTYLRLKSIPKPITYWWYTPTIYNVNTLFTPTFVDPISPYVQLWIPI